MKILYTYHDLGGDAIKQFLQTLHPKQQERLLWFITMLLLPRDTIGKPPVKHFQMDRYRRLFELRDKYKTTLSRVIFTYDSKGNVIILEAFIKNHKRKTDAALETALAKLRRIEHDPAQFLLKIDTPDLVRQIV